MDQQTRQIYETRAHDWVGQRRANQLENAQALAGRSTGPSVDLGCGPGWHTATLPEPAIALDCARSMLDLVRDHAPRALRVQADLVALPFRPGALHTAWARHSYVHVTRTAVPLALAELQRAMPVGGQAAVGLFLGGDEGRDVFPNDDFRGRFFSRWDQEQLVDVITGAGFTIDRHDVRANDAREQAIHLALTRERTLPDIVGPGMRMLVCGLNPSLYAADMGVGYGRPGNRFWPAALGAGLVTVDRDPWRALRDHGIGFTDVVKRATVAAAELTNGEYREGMARVDRLVTWLQPGVVAFVGLAGWRAAVDRKAVAGRQERTIGGRPVYVLPSSSGLNTHATVASLSEHLRAALALT